MRDELSMKIHIADIINQNETKTSGQGWMRGDQLTSFSQGMYVYIKLNFKISIIVFTICNNLYWNTIMMRPIMSRVPEKRPALPLWFSVQTRESTCTVLLYDFGVK